jgi:hypothetical protein
MEEVMISIKALAAAAACAIVLPVISAETDAAKAVDKAKAEAKAEAKKPAATKEKVAGQVSVPALTSESVDKSANGATQQKQYRLEDSRWVPKEDRS